MVRAQFADTAYWTASLMVDKRGMAEVFVDLPDNLTTWKIRAWVMSRGARVGEATTELVATKNVIARLDAPRFLIEGDDVTLSAHAHNYLDRVQATQIRMEAEGNALALSAEKSAQTTVKLQPGKEYRLDVAAHAEREGAVKLRAIAQAQEEADAMELSLPVHVHGMPRAETWNVTLRPEQSRARVEFSVPEKRRPEQTVLQLSCSASLSCVMVDALPYLADYPYGCTEQTLNRFVLALVTYSALKRAALNPADVAKRPRPAMPGLATVNPLSNENLLRETVRKGLQKLYGMQNEDGGWGWFSGESEHSFPDNTATVVQGLILAQGSGRRRRQRQVAEGLALVEQL